MWKEFHKVIIKRIVIFLKSLNCIPGFIRQTGLLLIALKTDLSPLLVLIRFNPVINNKERNPVFDFFGKNIIIIYHCPVELVSNTFNWSAREKIPFFGQKMIVKNIGNHTGIFMILFRKENL